MKTHALVALLIALIAAAPLTYPGPLQTHAGFTPLYALMDDPLARQAVGLLPYALTKGLHQAGLSPLDALKTLDALALGIGALGVFLLARQLDGDEAGLASAALYAMLPYRLMTTYVLGALGESLFLGLLPWSLLAARRMPQPLRRSWRGAKRTAHIVLRPLLIAVLLIILWKLCVPHTPDPSQAQVYLFQLFSARWDDGSRGNWLDAVPLQLGLAPVGLSVIALVVKPDKRALRLAALAAALCLLSIVPISQWWPWAWLLDAPWQLLGIAGLCLSLLGGSLVARDERMRTMPALATILTLTVLASYAYLAPRGLDYTPTHPPIARFGDRAYLVDVQFDTTVPRASTTQLNAIEPDTTLTVTLRWQDITPFTDDYKVFVHAIDAQGKIWAQRDAPPLNGARPTRTWQRGELLTDTYALTIPPNAPANLSIAIGLYREDTGVRLKTISGLDRIIAHP